MYVHLDGQDVALHVNCADHRGSRDAMRQFMVHLPPLAKGQHTVGFRIDNNVSTDRSVILDDVRLVPIAKGEFVSVPNAGFESVEQISQQPNNGYYMWAPKEATWSFISTYTNLVDNGDGTVTTNVTTSVQIKINNFRSAQLPELEDLYDSFIPGVPVAWTNANFVGWSVSGLPSGLSFNSTLGVISFSFMSPIIGRI
jgi:hypothetical protein